MAISKRKKEASVLFPILTVADYFQPTSEAAGICGNYGAPEYVETVEPVQQPQRAGRCLAAIVDRLAIRRIHRKQTWV